MSKRIPGILAVIVVIFLLMEMTFQTRQQENKEAVEPENVSPLLVWYTDPEYTDLYGRNGSGGLKKSRCGDSDGTGIGSRLYGKYQ